MIRFGCVEARVAVYDGAYGAVSAFALHLFRLLLSLIAVACAHAPEHGDGCSGERDDGDDSFQLISKGCPIHNFLVLE